MSTHKILDALFDGASVLVERFQIYDMEDGAKVGCAGVGVVPMSILQANGVSVEDACQAHRSILEEALPLLYDKMVAYGVPPSEQGQQTFLHELDAELAKVFSGEQMQPQEGLSVPAEHQGLVLMVFVSQHPSKQYQPLGVGASLVLWDRRPGGLRMEDKPPVAIAAQF